MSDPITKLIKTVSDLEKRIAKLERQPAGPNTQSLDLAIEAGVAYATRPYQLLVPESGSSDDLDGINNGRDGKILVLRVRDDGVTITLRDATGNLALAGDCVLDDKLDTITLLYDQATSAWVELCRSNNA